MAQSLNELIEICKDPNRKERLKSITKESMADLIGGASAMATPQDQSTEMRNLMHSMSCMTQEMQQLRASNDRLAGALDRIDSIERRLNNVTTDNEKLRKVVLSQQVYLESIDARERSQNAIVMGVPESEDQAMGVDDEAKMQLVMQTIEIPWASAQVTAMKRLREQAANKKRPILLTFATTDARNKTLENAKKLNSATGTHSVSLKKIFVKKDVHPMWKKEHARLRRVVKEEKEKPGNAGIHIEYDYKNRVVLRDGVVIDRFQPVF
jgi:hypothetical protein